MTNLLLMFGVFVASFVVGYILIVRVPTRLHTPLMSMTNAISGVTILGCLLLFAITKTTESETVRLTAIQMAVGAVAIVLATFNVVGGFTITDRMLKMFQKKDGSS